MTILDTPVVFLQSALPVPEPELHTIQYLSLEGEAECPDCGCSEFVSHASEEFDSMECCDCGAFTESDDMYAAILPFESL